MSPLQNLRGCLLAIAAFALIGASAAASAQGQICQTEDILRFPSLLTGSADTQRVEVWNCGFGVLTLTDVGALTASPHFSVSGSCASGLRLNQDARCDLSVRYQPQAAGNHNIAIKLYNSSPTPTQFLTAYGSAAAPGTGQAVLRWSVSTATASNPVPAAQSRDLPSVTLQNTGTAAVRLDSFAIEGPTRSEWSARTDCPQPGWLGAGASCSLTPRVSPLIANLRAASIVVSATNQQGSALTDSAPHQLRLSLQAMGSAALSSRVAVVEYFHPALNHYFMTADALEAAGIEAGAAGAGWERTPQVFFARGDAAATGVQPVCRFYGNTAADASGKPLGPNSHFYTLDAAECARLQAIFDVRVKSWRYEGTAFFVAAASSACPVTQQVRRLYNQGFPSKDSNHRYVTTAALADAMRAQGWVDEGVAFCAGQ